MPAIVRGKENNTNLINWFTTVNGILTDAYAMQFRIFNIIWGLPGTQIYPTVSGNYEDVTNAPGKFATGSYYAYDNNNNRGWTPELDADVGTHRIEWRWKANASSTWQSDFEDVEILASDCTTGSSSIPTVCETSNIAGGLLTVGTHNVATRSGYCLSGSHMAVGWWGRDPHKRILAEQEHAKQRILLQDKMKAGGLRTSLWQSNTDGNRCACYKESNEHADRKCKSCHGTGNIPGYLKFGFTTVWMSVVDNDITLTNCKITTDFKSAKVILNDSAISGTIESGDKVFYRIVVGSNWEYEESSFIRIANESNVIVEYSLDSGLNWFNISELPTANPASGRIRFRATLTRTSIGILSPLFEIVRARFERIAFYDLQPCGNYRWGPWIFILREVPTNRYVKSEHGDHPSRTLMRFWTTGLSMFDPDIEVGSRNELISADDKGPSDFIEILDGAMVGTRFVIIERQHSDPFGYIIVQQNFISRSANPAGPYNLVW